MKLLTEIFASIIFIFCIAYCTSENRQPAKKIDLTKFGSSRNELKKVLDHYDPVKTPLKFKAAVFLIENLEDQYFYDANEATGYPNVFNNMDSSRLRGAARIKLWDSLVIYHQQGKVKNLRMVPDHQIIKAEYLIHNIEMAFKVWKRPYNQYLSFEQFCEYVLPYKTAHEKPEYWRDSIYNRYNKLLAHCTTARAACNIINEDLKKWFQVAGVDFKYPYDINYSDLKKCRIGKCTDAAHLALFSMRAMGIPIAHDYTPYWANKGLGHSWNALILNNGRLSHFLGAESTPGVHKVEFANYNMRRKRAKVFRNTYAIQKESLASLAEGEEIPEVFENKHIIDVSNKYVKVSTIEIALNNIPSGRRFAYLCVFNNHQWRAIHWAEIDGDKATFTDMGRDIAYMPMYYAENELTPAGEPFILNLNGEINVLKADTNHSETINLYRKYPESQSNEIFPGYNYEVFYWKNGWISLGEQKAINKYVCYKNAPLNALFWIKGKTAGKEERIFTIKNGKQVWW